MKKRPAKKLSKKPTRKVQARKTKTVHPLAGQGKDSRGALVTRDLIARGKHYYTFAYKPRETILDRGEGSMVWDLEGKDYVDFGAGIAVTGLGHHNHEMLDVLIKQAHKLWHTSNIFYTEPPIRLAEELVRASRFAKRVFFTNSGAEANEAAIKLARKYAADKGRPPERRNILTFTGSFHGRTLTTVTATAQPKYQAGFEPLPPGFIYAPYNDFEAAARMIDQNCCAVMIETIQGEGGITPVKPGYLKHLQDLCRKADALLIIDDVQAGIGRTGHFLSHMAYPEVVPDVVTLAKALGGGMPIGAALIGPRAENTFQFGSHGSTFGGNPLSCAVARVVVKKLQSPALIKNIEARAAQLVKALEDINAKNDIFTEIRGRGLMIGAELKPKWHGKAGEINETARAFGVLVLQAGPNVLRFVPPLVITQQEMKEGISRLKRSIDAYLGKGN